MIVSEVAFIWFASGCILLISVCWLVWDAIRLRRFWPRRTEEHDQVFGSIIGLLVSLIGIIGVMRYHL